MTKRTVSVKCTAFIVLLVICLAGAEAGAVTVFSNDSAYSAAVDGQLFLIDFNGSPGALVNGSTISTYATFGSPEAGDPAFVNWSGDELSDAGSTTDPIGVGPLSIAFTDPVFAFSLQFSSAVAAETVELYDAGNVLIASVLSQHAWGFFGVLSDTAIDSVIIRNGFFPSNTRDRFFIDDLRANNVSVPEPATGLLVWPGLLAAVLWRRVAGGRK